MNHSHKHFLPRSNSALLYLITNDQDLPNARKLVKAVSEALDAGTHWIQFRTKPGTHAPFPKFSDRVAIAQTLKTLCDAHNALLFINDEVALATEVGAHLHLGQGDTELTKARQTLLPSQFIGITCHDQPSLAQAAYNHGADYVSFGAFFSSTTKPHARPAQLKLLKQPELPPLPKVAIGGITPENAPSLLSAGADVLAVSHAILGAQAPKKACQAFLDVLSTHKKI